MSRFSRLFGAAAGRAAHVGGTTLALGSAVYAAEVPGAGDGAMVLGWGGVAVAIAPVIVQVSQAIKADREAERSARTAESILTTQVAAQQARIEELEKHLHARERIVGMVEDRLNSVVDEIGVNRAWLMKFLESLPPGAIGVTPAFPPPTPPHPPSVMLEPDSEET
jgi:hypothetical protein